MKYVSLLFAVALIWILSLPWETSRVNAFPLEKTAETRDTNDTLFNRLMNVGKAYVEIREAEKATNQFNKALKLYPKSPEALRNLARALRMAAKNEEAREILIRAKAVEPPSAATSYLLGLVHVDSGEYDRAVSEFEAAVQNDPITPTLRFQLALAYERVGEKDKAEKQLYETVRLEPFHVNAQYKLIQYARKRKDKAETLHRLREVKRLRRLFGSRERDRNILEKCIYTAPELPKTKHEDLRSGKPNIDVTFTDATAEVFPANAQSRALLATVLEQDDTGRYTLAVIEKNGTLRLMAMTAAGSFSSMPVALGHSLLSTYTRIIVGNFYDDVPAYSVYDPEVHSLNDLFLIGPDGADLLLRTGKNSFRNVTEISGLKGVKGRDALWIDYEHDGDLDLLIAGNAGLEFWQNNGDLTFTKATADVGIYEKISAVAVVAADLDANNAIDVIVARRNEGTLVLENQRTGMFTPMLQPPGPWPFAQKVAVDDLNNDRHPDALLLNTDHAEILYGRSGLRQRIPFPTIDATGVVFVDFDNDGFLDILVFGRKRENPSQGRVKLWRNGGESSLWVDVTDGTRLDGVEMPPVRDVVVADLDHDRDSDLLLVTSDDRLHFMRNEGGDTNGQLHIRLVGTKSNPLGIGTTVEIRDSGFLVTRTVSGVPMEIGLGGRKKLDVIRSLWSTGVIDNAIQPSSKGDAGAEGWTVTLRESHVDTGSCPFLYAWDGQRFRFVTDILGNAPIGLPLSRSDLLPADPDEYVYVGDTHNFRPRDGSYILEVTSEFKEVLYLDSAKLVVVDHPPGMEIHPTDKIQPPPFPPSELWALASPIPLVDAWGSDGENYREDLSEIDDRYTPPGVLLPPPYRGMCNPFSLTLDFGKMDASRPLVLALTGWRQYGQASGNIAASQNRSIAVIPPMLEFKAASGEWKKLDVIVGMPAGKTKTILVDLRDKLPKGIGSLRLTTTFEIRWDRIALFDRSALTSGTTRGLMPTDADLRWRGFSEIKFRGKGHPKTPDYGKVFPRPPWRTSVQGWCTRYGEVDELVADTDQALVVMNGGDTLTLKFSADDIGPVPKGMERSFFFYSYGWEKDGDHNVTSGNTVYPMPGSGALANQDLAIDEESDWQLRYNTRWIGAERFDTGAF